MSNYLRKLGVFHTPPPLSVPQDATLTGYVINTNGLRPVTLYGDDIFDKGRLHNKMSILRDTVMELNIDVRAPPWFNGSTSTMQDWRSWVQFT